MSTTSVSYSSRVANSILDYLKAKGQPFYFDDNKGILNTDLPTSSKFARLNIHIRFLPDGYISHTTARINADSNARSRVAEFLTRANYGMRNGNFELDFRDGEIRFKVFCRSGDTILSDSQITDAIVTPLIQFDTYGDALLSVLFGWKTPEEAIQEAEAN